ncbi:MAG: SUMF1/EgtB/PvdO family nonheme iron enzyme, partial [Gemmatimonadetes bacterium]|nr:SUMF1/EgtB/PvdO family nonheme iron enzyme [Gemmatimonadota bacterium]
VLGTPAYMAPEQARGHSADARSDVFSLGSVFYEMLTGRRPFQRDSYEQSIQALLHDEPESVTSASRKVPRELESILRKCLAKEPDQRYANGDALHDALRAVHERQLAIAGGNAWWRRPVVVLPLLIVALVAVGWVVLDRMKAAEAHRVRTELLPRIEQLLEQRAGFEPLMLALEAQRKLPGDPAVDKLVEAASVPVRVTSQPDGAAVSIHSYMDVDSAGAIRCNTPCDIRIPPSYLVFRAEADGYETLEIASAGFGTEIPLTLQPVGAAPEGMLRAPADRGGRPGEETFEFPAYWVDRYEVSNRQFQEFVSAGGYANPEYWPPHFTDGGKQLTLAQARVRFVDETGRPGPAGWQLSQYPEGEADLPVRGISAFEAEAYAAWRGRSLPTFHHWHRFAGRGYFAEILLTGNFDSDAVGEVGVPRALGPLGTYDTAGNVREWTSTDVGDRRYAMGGSYEDPPYTFSDDGANSPWDRLPTIGFRTVLYDSPPPPIAFEPFDATRFDFADVEVISDEVYELVAERYAYASRELDAQVERTDDSSELWVHETVSFTSVYGGTRVKAHLFLPTNAEPPYQTVLFRPGAAVNLLTRVDDFIVFLPRYVPRSGRAVVVPALYGTLGRQDPDGLTDRLMRQVQDMMRTVEYLKTRDDIDADRIAYVGLSAGGEYGPCYVANLPDLKAAVLMAAGYHDAHMLDEPRDQVPWNFAPRVTQPVLMINTDNDFTLPYELAQKPMFDQLGTPPEDKRHVIVEGGHIPFDQTEVIRETLDWLDRYLGPVARPEVR